MTHQTKYNMNLLVPWPPLIYGTPRNSSADTIKRFNPHGASPLAFQVVVLDGVANIVRGGASDVGG